MEYWIIVLSSHCFLVLLTSWFSINGNVSTYSISLPSLSSWSQFGDFNVFWMRPKSEVCCQCFSWPFSIWPFSYYFSFLIGFLCSSFVLGPFFRKFSCNLQGWHVTVRRIFGQFASYFIEWERITTMAVKLLHPQLLLLFTSILHRKYYYYYKTMSNNIKQILVSTYKQ